MSETLIEAIRKRLNRKTIHDLRQIGRAVGVHRPAEGKKDRLVDSITEIASGEADPVKPSNRGAHPKSCEYDRQLVADIFRCREICLSDNISEDETSTEMTVGSGLEGDALDFNAKGILEKSDGKWFIRVHGCKEDLCSDVFVSDYFIENYALREGDFIFGRCKRNSVEEIAGLVVLKTVNSLPAAPTFSRTDFDSLTPVYPDRKISVSDKIIDLFAPFGLGQRVLVSGAYGSGKTKLLMNICRGLLSANAGLKIIILSLGAGAEEAAEYSRAFSRADVFTSPLGSPSAVQVRTARLALEYAKRQAETGKDAVLVLDDLTKLTRALNSCGKQVCAALDSQAAEIAKKFVSSAKNAAEGGSLTVITALASELSDIVDAAIYSELKGAFNNRINISDELSRSGVEPPIDLATSGAVGAERLLGKDELALSVKLRGENIRDLIEKLK